MPSGAPPLGFHHATSFASDPTANYRFYTRGLGMKLVKHTVNFDEPSAHHFYFSSANGEPGTILTSFPGYHHRPHIRQNLVICLTGDTPRNLEEPDGQTIEFLPDTGPLRIFSAKLKAADPQPSIDFFREVMGFSSGGPYLIAPGENARVEVVEDPEASRPRFAAGIVHHVAFSVANDDEQIFWRETLMKAGVRVSQVKDRCYFHSIYFREPSGILLEIATKGPGFTKDEGPADLGKSLKLPPWFEPIRSQIEARLIPFDKTMADHVP